jgi:lipoprotein-anchoring transpeptidase ErfK/SrfK
VNVIVINKAASGSDAQTLRLYTNRQLMLTTKVSTGAENLEYVSTMQGFFRLFSKGATDSHWRHTTRGFYDVKRVEGEKYKSSENSFHMPYAMFFNDKHGLAVHQVPPDLGGGEAAGEAQLGSRASSGCVRVSKDYIVQIHDAVEQAGQGRMPVIDTATGKYVLDASGNVQTKVGWRSIVIVQED